MSGGGVGVAWVGGGGGVLIYCAQKRLLWHSDIESMSYKCSLELWQQSQWYTHKAVVNDGSFMRLAAHTPTTAL